MTDELDEWILDEVPGRSVGGQHEHDTVVGEHDTEAEDEEGLHDDVAASEAGDSFIPDTSQQLLNIRVSHE